MSATGNLDVITWQDDDAPRKQPLAHTLTLFTTTTVWATSPSGARDTDNPLDSALYVESAGTNLLHGSPSRQMPVHLSFEYKTQLHCGRSPWCINRAVVPP
jgi:hypothetical protein